MIGNDKEILRLLEALSVVLDAHKKITEILADTDKKVANILGKELK